MLTNYIEAAMRQARYERLPEDKTYYGEIPGFAGVYANSNTLESCRQGLKEVLEEWILLRLSRNHSLPDAVLLA
ncbi:MAG: type II toxin-antitoxin system HicB family antitoxin [Chloroflexota bacterium]|nr:type II toxin-antitoxin system HicB family antitoxin [Chloroflexota bacterium]